MLDDEVVGIEIVPFDGDVYNLTVDEDNSYILNEIVTHNCLCYKTAVLMLAAQFTDNLRGWMRGEQTWPAMDQYAAMFGGDVGADMSGSPMLASLVLWAFGSPVEMAAVVRDQSSVVSNQ